MSEELKAIVRRFGEEIWHKGNLDAIEEFIAPDYVRHTSHYREGRREVQGPEGARQSIAALRAAFPDVHFTEDDILVAGDKVVTRWTFHGTHRRPFLGVAPTGKHVTFTGINIYRIARGKIVERWASEDAISLYQQLGLLAPQASTPERRRESGGARPGADRGCSVVRSVGGGRHGGGVLETIRVEQQLGADGPQRTFLRCSWLFPGGPPLKLGVGHQYEIKHKGNICCISTT